MIYPVVLHKEKNSERLPTRDPLKKCAPQKLRTVFGIIGSASWWRWLELPVRPLATVIVAVVFAMVFAVAVPRCEPVLLGFLSVISVLWMSSSLSLLDIVGEREVFDHEHHLFVKVRAYLEAKLTSNLILAVLQTVMFFATLEMMRQQQFPDWKSFGGISGLNANAAAIACRDGMARGCRVGRSGRPLMRIGASKRSDGVSIARNYRSAHTGCAATV